MLDGRHTGTGGGNHVVLGGATPADSPFLRRPDLLRSLVAYWHNHPSLSYLFSGLFIGPTSQAPRVDEARHDALYELEIAFAPAADEPARAAALAGRPHLPQPARRRHRQHAPRRVLHRQAVLARRSRRPAAACVELRAFEMPPHARMSLAQQLLLRALVARFWRAAVRRSRWSRWGTELHDRFMLPHFVAQDFQRRARRPARGRLSRFDAAWFAPHFEFRFPLLRARSRATACTSSCARRSSPGTCSAKKPGAGGTARYVDSSVERLQVQRARA